MIGYCPKCGSRGQVNDVCQLCGEHYTTEPNQQNISKYYKIYDAQSDNNVVISTKNTTKIIIAVVAIFSLISVSMLLLNRESDEQKATIVPSLQKTSIPIQESNIVQETPVVKETPVIPAQRIEDRPQISNDYKYKTDLESKPQSDESPKITKADIQSAMRAAAPQIRACARTSTVKGSMKVSFVITAKGGVKNAKVVSPEFGGQPVEKCILQIINNLKFAKTGQDIPVFNYPIQIQ